MLRECSAGGCGSDGVGSGEASHAQPTQAHAENLMAMAASTLASQRHASLMADRSLEAMRLGWSRGELPRSPSQSYIGTTDMFSPAADLGERRVGAQRSPVGNVVSGLMGRMDPNSLPKVPFSGAWDWIRELFPWPDEPDLVGPPGPMCPSMERWETGAAGQDWNGLQLEPRPPHDNAGAVGIRYITPCGSYSQGIENNRTSRVTYNNTHHCGWVIDAEDECSACIGHANSIPPVEAVNDFNPPLVCSFESTLDTPADRREGLTWEPNASENFRHFVRAAWAMLRESLDLIQVVLECLHPTFRTSDDQHEQKRENLYNTLRSGTNNGLPRVYPECRPPNGRCYDSSQIIIIPGGVEDRVQVWRARMKAENFGDPRIWWNAYDLTMRSVFNAYVNARDITEGNRPRLPFSFTTPEPEDALNGAVIHLAGTLFHEMLHVFFTPPAAHDPTEPCDDTYVGHYLLTNLLIKRYSFETSLVCRQHPVPDLYGVDVDVTPPRALFNIQRFGPYESPPQIHD